MNQGVPDVSVVIPAYNEETNLPLLHEEIVRAFSGRPESVEVLYVDDGSTDKSRAVLERMAGADRRVRGIFLRHNSGQSAALEAGVRVSRGRIIVTLDADLQNDPADIPALLDRMEGVHAVVGFRAKRQDTWLKRVTSKVGNGIRNRLTGDDIRDTGCSLKAFRREVLERMPFFKGMHRFMPTLVRLQGGAVDQVAVNHRPRIHGQSKYGLFNRMFVTAADVMAVRWMQKRHVRWEIESETGGGGGA